MTIPTDSFTLAAAVNGFLVRRPDGSHESIPVESDRFRVIAEGAWRRVIATGATLYRTFGTDYAFVAFGRERTLKNCRPERITSSYADSYCPHGTLSWDLCEHHRLVEEARKATEVAA